MVQDLPIQIFFRSFLTFTYINTRRYTVWENENIFKWMLTIFLFNQNIDDNWMSMIEIFFFDNGKYKQFSSAVFLRKMIEIFLLHRHHQKADHYCSLAVVFSLVGWLQTTDSIARFCWLDCHTHGVSAWLLLNAQIFSSFSFDSGSGHEWIGMSEKKKKLSFLSNIHSQMVRIRVFGNIFALLVWFIHFLQFWFSLRSIM